VKSRSQMPGAHASGHGAFWVALKPCSSEGDREEIFRLLTCLVGEASPAEDPGPAGTLRSKRELLRVP
jgi:hypothetical protein